MNENVSMDIWKQGLKRNYCETLTPAFLEKMFWKMEEGQIFDKNFTDWNLYGKICSSFIWKYRHTSIDTYMCEWVSIYHPNN